MSATIFPGAGKRSERLARRALGFALDPQLSPMEAAVLLGDLAAHDVTTLTLARARILKTPSGGPVSTRAADALGIALQSARDETHEPSTSTRDGERTNGSAPSVGLVLLGPPGAGKGTQGRRLAQRYGVPHLSTGNILRDLADQETAIGFQAQVFMNSGRLVPDALVLELVDARLAESDARRAFILDGFPRTLSQAQALETLYPRRITAVIELIVPPVSAATRLRFRGRPDDAPETVTRRMDEYKRETGPVVALFEQRGLLTRIDGDRPADAVTTDLLGCLNLTAPRHTSARNPEPDGLTALSSRNPDPPPEVLAAAGP